MSGTSGRRPTQRSTPGKSSSRTNYRLGRIWLCHEDQPGHERYSTDQQRELLYKRRNARLARQPPMESWSSWTGFDVSFPVTASGTAPKATRSRAVRAASIPTRSSRRPTSRTTPARDPVTVHGAVRNIRVEKVAGAPATHPATSFTVTIGSTNKTLSLSANTAVSSAASYASISGDPQTISESATTDWAIDGFAEVSDAAGNKNCTGNESYAAGASFTTSLTGNILICVKNHYSPPWPTSRSRKSTT